MGGEAIKIYPAEGYGVHIRSAKVMSKRIQELSKIPELLNIERLFTGESVASQQYPSGLGAALQIEFGPTQVTDDMTLDSTGKLTVHTTGLYRIKVALQFGRNNGGGPASLIMFRALFDGTQVGRSLSTKLGNAKDTAYLENDEWLELPEGLEITYELIRDSSGSNNGGLLMLNSADGWNSSPTALIRIQKYEPLDL